MLAYRFYTGNCSAVHSLDSLCTYLLNVIATLATVLSQRSIAIYAHDNWHNNALFAYKSTYEQICDVLEKHVTDELACTGSGLSVLRCASGIPVSSS
jgi:hypothetical protein